MDAGPGWRIGRHVNMKRKQKDQVMPEEGKASSLEHLIDRMLEYAPDCLVDGIILKAVKWEKISKVRVSRVLKDISAKGIQVPQWLLLDLIMAGHVIPSGSLKHSEPLIRVANKLNSIKNKNFGQSKHNQIVNEIEQVGIIHDITLCEFLVSGMLELGLLKEAAAFSLKHWRHIHKVDQDLIDAQNELIGSWPVMDIELLSLSSLDQFAEDLFRAFAANKIRVRTLQKQLDSKLPEVSDVSHKRDFIIIILDGQSMFQAQQSGTPEPGSKQSHRKQQEVLKAVKASATQKCPIIVNTVPYAPEGIGDWSKAEYLQAINKFNGELRALVSTFKNITCIESAIALSDIAAVDITDQNLQSRYGMAYSHNASQAYAEHIVNTLALEPLNLSLDSVEGNHDII